MSAPTQDGANNRNRRICSNSNNEQQPTQQSPWEKHDVGDSHSSMDSTTAGGSSNNGGDRKRKSVGTGPSEQGNRIHQKRHHNHSDSNNNGNDRIDLKHTHETKNAMSSSSSSKVGGCSPSQQQEEEQRSTGSSSSSNTDEDDSKEVLSDNYDSSFFSNDTDEDSKQMAEELAKKEVELRKHVSDLANKEQMLQRELSNKTMRLSRKRIVEQIAHQFQSTLATVDQIILDHQYSASGRIGTTTSGISNTVEVNSANHDVSAMSDSSSSSASTQKKKNKASKIVSYSSGGDRDVAVTAGSINNTSVGKNSIIFPIPASSVLRRDNNNKNSNSAFNNAEHDHLNRLKRDITEYLNRRITAEYDLIENLNFPFESFEQQQQRQQHEQAKSQEERGAVVSSAEHCESISSDDNNNNNNNSSSSSSSHTDSNNDIPNNSNKSGSEWSQSPFSTSPAHTDDY